MKHHRKVLNPAEMVLCILSGVAPGAVLELGLITQNTYGLIMAVIMIPFIAWKQLKLSERVKFRYAYFVFGGFWWWCAYYTVMLIHTYLRVGS